MQPILKIPETGDVVKASTGVYWRSEEGFIYFVGIKSKPIGVEEVKAFLDDWGRMAGDNTLCLLADSTHIKPADRVIKDYAAVEFPKHIAALAVVSGSPMGRMVANLFFLFKPMPYPAKMFETEELAKEWLRQYLKPKSDG